MVKYSSISRQSGVESTWQQCSRLGKCSIQPTTMAKTLLVQFVVGLLYNRLYNNNSNNSHLMAVCPGLRGWTSTRRNVFHSCGSAHGFYGSRERYQRQTHRSRWTTCAPTSIIPTIFMPVDLHFATLPIYAGLGCTCSGLVVQQIHNKSNQWSLSLLPTVDCTGCAALYTVQWLIGVRAIDVQVPLAWADPKDDHGQ